jgi:hypothetical protein
MTGSHDSCRSCCSRPPSWWWNSRQQDTASEDRPAAGDVWELEPSMPRSVLNVFEISVHDASSFPSAAE